jgi:hypothetical protein
MTRALLIAPDRVLYEGGRSVRHVLLPHSIFLSRSDVPHVTRALIAPALLWAVATAIHVGQFRLRALKRVGEAEG